MARVSLSEYRAKSLLVPGYDGVRLGADTAAADSQRLDPTTRYVIKVDQGVKQRGKQGLLRLDVAAKDAAAAVAQLATKGYRYFLAEPMVPHAPEDERYVSFERTRRGIIIHYSPHGGVDIEEHADSVSVYRPDTVPLPADWVQHVLKVMDQQHLSLVEINPLVQRGDKCVLLDAAVLADSAGQHQADWSDQDVANPRQLTPAEAAVATLDDGSPASFALRVLNPDGAIWLLLSGGGASITIADRAAALGRVELIGNYGEYSGGPTSDETYRYTTQVLRQALASSAPVKALVIAGGVANFTDVKRTFDGIIRALREHLDQLHQHHMRVFVRRGGPGEAEGLAAMRTFLAQHDLLGQVSGSEALLDEVITQAAGYVDA